MFADMCNEHNKHGQDARGLAYKIYAETFMGILKERIQEVVMNIKTAKPRFVIGASIGLVGIIVAIVLLNNDNHSAQSIQPGSWLKDVRAMSKGDKNACLANVPSAADAIKLDDESVEYQGNKFSNFEMTAGGAIADVPAGTNYTLTTNTYTNNIAKGTMTYDKDYGVYNYTIQKLPKAGEWKLVSIIACKKP
jgi:hypothetical protein